MMIKINLLPVRQAKKREAGKQILILYAVLVVGALVGNYFWYDWRESAAQDVEAKVARTNQKIAELQKVIGEVDNINARKKELQDKLAVLKQLKSGRTGPVRIMDALAEATPKKVWIREFDESNQQVKLTGSAMSHEDVAELMRGLSEMVWTPKGMGRVVEQKKDTRNWRVELIGQNGATEEFAAGEVGNFFTEVELKNATQSTTKTEVGELKTVDFLLSLKANYTL